MAANDDYYVKCINCTAKNKLPLAKLGQSPTCGKCKKRLFSDRSPVGRGSIIIPCKQCQTGNKVPIQKLDDQPRCGKCKNILPVNLSNHAVPSILTDQNFAETVLKSPFPFLVNFHSPDCGPCKLLLPTINKIAKDYQGRLRVGSLDVNSNQYIPSLYRVGGTPTLLIFQSGKETHRLEGYHPSSTLTRWLQPHTW